MQPMSRTNALASFELNGAQAVNVKVIYIELSRTEFEAHRVALWWLTSGRGPVTRAVPFLIESLRIL